MTADTEALRALEQDELIALNEGVILAEMMEAGKVQMDTSDARFLIEAARELIRLRAEVETVRTEAKRMDLARNQFLGERNMLQEALRDIQRGDMTNMMEFTEAEAAKIRAGWALKKIGQPVKPAAPEVQP